MRLDEMTNLRTFKGEDACWVAAELKIICWDTPGDCSCGKKHITWKSVRSRKILQKYLQDNYE